MTAVNFLSVTKNALPCASTCAFDSLPFFLKGWIFMAKRMSFFSKILALIAREILKIFLK